MRWPSDDVVLIQNGKEVGEPSVITVNCPDKLGLASDICRTVLDSGLYVTKADFSTDGLWCYIVLWVLPQQSSLAVRWSNLKDRLVSVCPSCSAAFYLYQPSAQPTSSPVYLLKFFSRDRKGLLHDVTQLLCELELTIQMVKVMTTPDGRVLDLFFITDNLELLHTKTRQDETCERLHQVLGDLCISCELQLAGPDYQNHLGRSSLPVVSKEPFLCELSNREKLSEGLTPDMKKLKEASVTIDNSLSPAHTLLQIRCFDHKGLLYDILRTLKDCSIQIAHGRFSPNSKGFRELDLLIQQNDGKKILDSEKQGTICSCLKVEILHPVCVMVKNKGPDTELLVANPVELSGNGRPRVFYDVTLALKMLGICVFSAEIGRHSASDREWEIYRFLLDENCSFQISNSAARNKIVDSIRRTLMGW